MADAAERIRNRITIDRSCTADVVAIIRDEQDAEGVAEHIVQLLLNDWAVRHWVDERKHAQEIADLIRQGRTESKDSQLRGRL